jgi:hypothetical protein
VTAWVQTADIISWLGPDVTSIQAQDLADSATAAVLSWIERDLTLGTFNETYDSNGTDYILLDHWPIRTVTSVAINGEAPLMVAAFQKAGYALDPLVSRKMRFPGRRIPRGVMNIAVNYSAGYDMTQPVASTTGLPADVYKALQLTAAAIYNAAAADPNLSSENTAGVFTGSFYQTGVGAVPPGARSLLERFKRVA